MRPRLLLIGSLAGGAIEDSFGVDWVFRYAAGLSLLGVPVFIMFMRRGAAAPRAESPEGTRAG